MVSLKNSHIIISKDIADSLFPNESYVQAIYYDNSKTMMIARDTDDLFRSFHKAKRELLKDKNLQGDKSVNIREFIIDNDLDEDDKTLSCKPDETMHVLNIYF